MADSHEPMVVSTRWDGTTAVIVVEGELDLHASPKLTAAVEQVLAESPPAVEIDASGLTFADSAGLRALLMARNDAEKRGTDLRLVQVSEPLDRLLEMTGLREVLGIALT
jgi:anti-sigma B factor antagonist